MPGSRTWLASVIVLSVLVLSACSGGTETPEEPASPDDAIEVTEADDGKTMTAVIGDKVVVRLASNASTGYSWKITTAPDKAILAAAGHEYVQGEGDAPGTPGAELFLFDATAAGSTEIALDYVGPGTDAEVGESFSVTVEVGEQE